MSDRTAGLQDQNVGYNDEDSVAISEGIDNVYTATQTTIQNNIRDVIVQQVAANWYSEVAVDYFAEFKENTARIADDIRTVFQNFRDQIQEDVVAWRNQTGGSGGDIPDVAEKEIEIDVSAVKPTDTNGNRFISNTLETDVLEWIATCRTNIITDISQAVAENVVKSFIGEQQNEKVNAAMESLSVHIDGILNYLTMGDNSIVSSITKFRTEYTQTGSTNATNTEAKDYSTGADVTGGADDS